MRNKVFRVCLAKRWVQFWHSTFIPLVISGCHGILTSRDWKGTTPNEEHWVFSFSFSFSPLPFFSSFLSLSFFLFFSRCLDECSVFRKTPCQSFREIVCSRWWRNSIAHEERESSKLAGRTNAEFPRYTVIRWFSPIPGEVFLRFEETVSGFPQHLRRPAKDTERTKRSSTRRHRPSFLSLATTYACLRLYFIFPKDCVCLVGTRDVLVNIRLWNLVLKNENDDGSFVGPCDSYSVSYSDRSEKLSTKRNK